jgi:hypothetical protein
VLGLEIFVAEILFVIYTINAFAQKLGGWKHIWQELTFYLQMGGAAIEGWASAAWNWLKMVGGGIETFGKSVWAVAKSIFSAIPEAVASAFTIALHYAIVGITKLSNFIGSLPSIIGRYAANIFKAGVSIAKSFGMGIVHGLSYISGVAKSIYGALKGYINSAISSVNSGINHIGGFLHISPPNIPKLANGAIVNGPTTAHLGEAGREVVIPLTRPQRAAKLLRDSGLAAQLGMGQPAVSVSVYIGAEKLDDRIDTRVAVANDDTSAALAHGTRGF